MGIFKRTETVPSKRGKKATEQPVKKRRPLRRLLYWTSVASVWAGAVLFIYGLVLAHDLPDVNNLPPPGQRQRIDVLAGNGTPLASYGAIYGQWTEFRALPNILVQAVISVEDRRFFDHWGVDVRGVSRAIAANLTGGTLQGGSTITQQLAKNIFLSPERTFKRKSQELLLALWLEQKFEKRDILALYLNRVYFGAGTYGLDAAARTYFGHGAKTLSLSEAALLAGLLKAPSAYAPNRNPDRAFERMRVVLDLMVANQVITLEAAQHAKANPPRIAAPGSGSAARHFSDWIVARARNLIDMPNAPVIVQTTLDLNMQAAASRAMSTGLDGEGARRSAGQGALLALSTDGSILAMVGGRRYADSQFNRATSASRQPGSAFKPVVYLAAFEAGLEVTDIFEDEPITIGGWSPKNFSEQFSGPVSVRTAFSRSLNTVAVRISEQAGRPKVGALARRLGLNVPETPEPSVALGAYEVTPLEMAVPYGVIASGGLAFEPYAILEIRTLEGALLYRHNRLRKERLVDEEHVVKLTGLMQAVLDDGTGRAARIDRPAAGKTGTSQDFRDAWFAGFSSEIITMTWVGNDDGTPMKGVTGGGLPARIWRDFMLEAHAGLPVRPLQFAPAIAEEQADDS